MSDWQRGTTPQRPYRAGVGTPDVLELARGLTPDPGPRPAACVTTPDSSCVTRDGADWLASACALPSSVHALWRHRPASPSVLPCGTVFDVVSAPPLPGRLILERLWASGPGSGPVAVHRGRVLLFASPGTAQRLPALLDWGEWLRTPGGAGGTRETGRPDGATGTETFAPRLRPPLLCLGHGDCVTIPALHHDHPEAAAPRTDGREASADGPPSRWLVAPDVRHPWLPGPEALLRACVRARRDHADHRPVRAPAPVRAGRGLVAAEERISGTADRDARVYDVTRRR